MQQTSPKSFVITLFLCMLFGFLGAHRFYVGRKKSACFQLFTFGGLIIWGAIDFTMIIFKRFKDADGLTIG